MRKEYEPGVVNIWRRDSAYNVSEQLLTKLLIFLPGNFLLLFLPTIAIMYHKRQVKQWHLRNNFSPDSN